MDPDQPQGESCCDYKSLVGVFKALSDESRQRILFQLEERDEMRVSDLVDTLQIAQPNVSHHLSVLKSAGLVEDRRNGQSIYYRLNRTWLTEFCRDFTARFDDDE